MSRPRSMSRRLSGLASNASHSAANAAWIWRYGRPSCQKMKPLGSRNEPGSRAADGAGSAAAGGVIHGRAGPGSSGRGARWSWTCVDSSLVAHDPQEPADLVPEEDGAATIVAIAAWMIRLPEPGSMYASSKPNMSLLTSVSAVFPDWCDTLPAVGVNAHGDRTRRRVSEG